MVSFDLFARNMSVSCYLFCTYFVRELFFFSSKILSMNCVFCTESEYLHQYIISGVLREIFNCEHIELFISYFMSSYLQNCINFLKSKEVRVFPCWASSKSTLLLLVCSFPSCSRVQNVFLNFLIAQHLIHKWLSEIEGYR